MLKVQNFGRLLVYNEFSFQVMALHVKLNCCKNVGGLFGNLKQ